jgi:hypothetical protein
MTIVSTCLALEHLIKATVAALILLSLFSSLSPSSLPTCGRYNDRTLLIVATFILDCRHISLALLAYFAERLLVFIHATVVAKAKILGELKIVRQCLRNRVEKLVGTWFVMGERIKERACVTLLALETLLALPLALWYGFQRWVQAKRVKGLVTDIAI